MWNIIPVLNIYGTLSVLSWQVMELLMCAQVVYEANDEAMLNQQSCFEYTYHMLYLKYINK
jgi:hypothetical protein